MPVYVAWVGTVCGCVAVDVCVCRVGAVLCTWLVSVCVRVCGVGRSGAE